MRSNSLSIRFGRITERAEADRDTTLCGGAVIRCYFILFLFFFGSKITEISFVLRRRAAGRGKF